MIERRQFLVMGAVGVAAACSTSHSPPATHKSTQVSLAAGETDIDPGEKTDYDDELVLVLDDWIDGTGTNRTR
ncbi:MAG TPA: twin-arginine translocation signal domain-containing protein, partial [Mycobacterium sp.]|nr:twin-arginine translocation signal domain-containing protein [Mycobacterium sp.]